MMITACVKPHPYGVKAQGNAFLADDSKKRVRRFGLGSRFSFLMDGTVIEILGFLDGVGLAYMSESSRAFYVYAHHNDLWRDLTLRTMENRSIFFRSSWKESYVIAYCKDKNIPANISHQPFIVDGIFSDVLHRSWCCRTFQFETTCPGFEKFSDIQRRDARNLSIKEFVEEFEIPNIPVILTNLVSEWPAMNKWNQSYLCEACADIKFHSTSTTAPTAALFTLPEYFQYINQTSDEAPLYLFDRDYSHITALQNDYSIPAYFCGQKNPYGTDLFRLLGEKRRPDYRWLIIGPARSGSIFHIDPNQTNAWNAAIQGRKKWIFYPPGCPPPGVVASRDGGDVMVPLTTGEWLLSFWKHHLDARKHPDPSKRPLETVLQPGELIFIPHNWWHMVVNLENSIALTHNYVSAPSNLSDVLTFLREKSDQISGLRDVSKEDIQPDMFYDEFVNELKKQYPDLCQQAIEESFNKMRKYNDNNKNVNGTESTPMIISNILAQKKRNSSSNHSNNRNHSAMDLNSSFTNALLFENDSSIKRARKEGSTRDITSESQHTFKFQFSV